MRKILVAAALLAAMTGIGSACADDRQSEMATCAAMFLVSHDFGTSADVKPMADFLIGKAGKLRGQKLQASEIQELKNKVTLYALRKLKAGDDVTEWAEQTGVGCAVLAWQQGYRGEESSSGTRGSDKDKALAEQLGQMPGVSRW